METMTTGSNDQYKLFSGATWRKDTLVFVYPFCYPGSDPDDCSAPDLSKCKIVVGPLQAPFIKKSSACTVDKLLRFSQIATPFMTKMDEVKSGTQFYALIRTLSYIKMVDAFQSCKLLLESMPTTSEKLMWMPGQRRCTEEWDTEAWNSDPCCNPGLILLPSLFPSFLYGCFLL